MTPDGADCMSTRWRNDRLTTTASYVIPADAPVSDELIQTLRDAGPAVILQISLIDTSVAFTLVAAGSRRRRKEQGG